MFHSNHLKMIEYARGLGGTLIVGVSTDELVASYKKPPIIPFEERLAIIKALKFPDIVIPQHTLDHTEAVKKLNIDVITNILNSHSEATFADKWEVVHLLRTAVDRGSSTIAMQQHIQDIGDKLGKQRIYE